MLTITTIFQQLIKIKFFGALALLLGAFCTIREKLSFVEKIVIVPTIILGGLAQLYHKMTNCAIPLLKK